MLDVRSMLGLPWAPSADAVVADAVVAVAVETCNG